VARSHFAFSFNCICGSDSFPVGDAASPALLSVSATFTMAQALIASQLQAKHFSVRFSHPLRMPAIQSPVSEEVHPDVALVARAKAGDTAAFEQLVRQYERQIFRVAQHITQNREDAEDITQDAFLKAYEKLEQFQGNSKFSTWLVRIAVNESLMRLRKRKTSRTVSMDEDVQTEEGSIPRDFAEWRPNPEQQYNQAELGDILRKTIQGLPPGFRTVFTLRDIENLSTEETAEALGLSIPAVKSRLLRARLQLRERLSRYFRQKKESQPA
jgi:RNA polymerase sigma-70 factor (ECF subfamily)